MFVGVFSVVFVTEVVVVVFSSVGVWRIKNPLKAVVPFVVEVVFMTELLLFAVGRTL